MTPLSSKDKTPEKDVKNTSTNIADASNKIGKQAEDISKTKPTVAKQHVTELGHLESKVNAPSKTHEPKKDTKS